MLQNWSFSSSWQLDLQQHLFDTWAVSAQNQISVMVFTCHMCIDMVASCNLQDAAVWFQAGHQSLCCHLCSDGWGFSCEKSMSLIICVEVPMPRLFLFTNHLSSRFLAGERHRQTCVFIHMGMRLQLVASWFLSPAAAEIDLFIPRHLERWSVMSLFFGPFLAQWSIRLFRWLVKPLPFDAVVSWDGMLRLCDATWEKETAARMATVHL